MHLCITNGNHRFSFRPAFTDFNEISLSVVIKQLNIFNSMSVVGKNTVTKQLEMAMLSIIVMDT